jgi:rhamnose transport system substrate-binding protein
MNRMMLAIAMLATVALPAGAFAQATATPGKPVKMVLVPKIEVPDRISRVFDQVHDGAEQAAKELRNPSPLQYTGATSEGGGASQIASVTDATAQGVNAIMISNNTGDQIVPALKAAHDKGIKVVSWDSPIGSAEGEDVYVAQIDSAQAGKVLADMARNILGPDGGKLAILSNSPDPGAPSAWVKAFQVALRDAKYAKLAQVDLVYGNDEVEPSYKQALALVDKHPDLKLIVVPTSIGVVSAARAMRDRELCGKVKVTGFGLPREMRDYVVDGCAPQFALWSFTDLGYLAYYTAYLLATDGLKAQAGQSFVAGRLGSHTIIKDPVRAHGLRVVLGPWSVYDKANIEAAAR